MLLAGASPSSAVAVRHPLAARRIQHGAHVAARVGVEFGLGRPDVLEVQHVEELVTEDVAEDLGRRPGCVRVGDAHVVDGRDPLGVEAPHLPHDHGAPVVPGERRLVVAVVVEQSAQVRRQLVRPVGGHLGGGRAAAVAAQVGGEGAVPGVAQRAELVAPRVPELGEAVAEDHRRAIVRAGGRDVELHAVGLDLFVRDLSHAGVTFSPSPSEAWPAAFSAFSSWCFWMADMTALPAAPMNSGRFSAAQSRLEVSECAESWKRGAT